MNDPPPPGRCRLSGDSDGMDACLVTVMRRRLRKSGPKAQDLQLIPRIASLSAPGRIASRIGDSASPWLHPAVRPGVAHAAPLGAASRSDGMTLTTDLEWRSWLHRRHFHGPGTGDRDDARTEHDPAKCIEAGDGAGIVTAGGESRAAKACDGSHEWP